MRVWGKISFRKNNVTSEGILERWVGTGHVIRGRESIPRRGTSSARTRRYEGVEKLESVNRREESQEQNTGEAEQIMQGQIMQTSGPGFIWMHYMRAKCSHLHISGLIPDLGGWLMQNQPLTGTGRQRSQLGQSGVGQTAVVKSATKPAWESNGDWNWELKGSWS